ncbi:hypothetical protein QFC20_007391 [Naganishia adeliensis]|uniref:Uncharacterized protein n=1 Tax=Naganishia adeliensis TaxID=92952 RepID=A0ACC2UZ25_9TREE|nr:hypothetical protein QFC20_007391 [Naganishia adeliensis]
MPLEVSQDQGESGISVKTTAAEGEKLEVDQAAKARSNQDLAKTDGLVELENQAPDLISDLNGGNKKA